MSVLRLIYGSKCCPYKNKCPSTDTNTGRQEMKHESKGWTQKAKIKLIKNKTVGALNSR